MVFTESAIKEYLSELKAKSVNPTTIKRKTTALKHLQLFLIENGFLIESAVKRAGTGIVNPQILTVALTSAIA
jgi:site-specific recombinase XerD